MRALEWSTHARTSVQASEQTLGAPFGWDELRLRPDTALRVLLAAVIGFGLAGVASAYVHHVLGRESAFGFVPTFDLDREGNVPSWFSALVLTACAGSLYVIYRVKRTLGDGYARHWGGLAVIFAYFSLDEAAEVHELSYRPLRALFGLSDGLAFVSWIIPFGALALIVAALYLRFLLALPGHFRGLFVFAAVLFAGGAVGGELMSWGYRGPMLDAMPGDLDARLIASDSLTYALFAAGEEVCEMLGATVFLYALLAYLAAGRSTVMLKFDERPAVLGTWRSRDCGR
jgi:hypothetical protein